MKIKILVLLAFVSLNLNAVAFTITGKVGAYPIEMEIENVNWETGELLGKYRYANKESYLKLEGEILHDIVWMEESYKGEVTGTFYLVITDSGFNGKWISGKKWHDVVLNTTPEIKSKLSTKQIADYTKETTNSVSGGYGVETYFINDMWFREDNPSLEVGFNGGVLLLEEISNDSLRFYAQVVCGPTYHLAYASATAKRISENTYSCILNISEKDTCFVDIEIGEKSAHVTARGNFVCGFGARAYLDHEFMKITDQFKFDKEEVTLGDLIGTN